jgi:putative PIN family toxin of toxin-antitoxin system
MEKPKPVVVLDTGVFLQATISRGGPAAAILALFDRGLITLCVCDALLDEIREVLERPRIRRRNPHYSDHDIERLLDGLRRKAVAIPGAITAHFVYPRDPDDEYVISLAVDAGARFLVARDKDLLSLEDDPDFRRRFPDLHVLDPVAFLHELAFQ